jgi:hypothetical protein
MTSPTNLKSRTYLLSKVEHLVEHISYAELMSHMIITKIGADGVENIIPQEVDIPKLGAFDVLVRIHAVSLQVRVTHAVL